MASSNAASRESPYITNFDLVPPSPPRQDPIDFDHSSPFDSAFNLGQQQQQGIAQTPSYNGSYYNSPYSQHSELAELDLFNDDFSAPNGDYEPSDYDVPTDNAPGNSLLMFTNDSDYMSPHFSPGHDQQQGHRSPFDHGSPASSHGGGDDNNNGANNVQSRHSRASSVASHHHSPSPQLQNTMPNNHSPQPSFRPHPSPHLDVAQTFGNISIHTPNWGTQPLPGGLTQAHHSPNVHPSSLPQQQKPQSPPRLTMPQGILDASQPTAVPTINAPDGDDDMGGPSLNIVPATPIGGGGGVARGTFQQTLGTLAQGM